MLSTPQRFAQPSHPTGGAGVDGLCRFITQAVKDKSSAFIVSSYPLLSLQDASQSAMKKRCPAKRVVNEKFFCF